MLDSVDLPALQAALGGRYTVLRAIGSGGMATVWLARDDRHAREVAVKVLRPRVAASVGAERFLAEIRTTARLQHPHVLPLLDSGAAGDLLWYVMPFVDGESLRARLDREGELPVPDALRIGREVSDALQHAHRLGVVHRDVKPENILLHESHALLADFGIALVVGQGDAARLTTLGVAVGTPQYMSPEQAAGERTLTSRVDQFALAAVVYEMLSGDPPFVGPTTQTIIARVMTVTPPPLRTLRPTVPASAESAIARALEKRAADRFPSLAEFAQALGESVPSGENAGVLAPGGARSLPAVGVTPGRARIGRGLAILGLSGASALAGWAIARPTRAPPPAPEQRAVIPFGPRQLMAVDQHPLTISRDGSGIAYIGVSQGRNGLYVRGISDTVATLLDGTDGASSPFFSPDGQWLGFTVDSVMFKVPRRGGVPIALLTLPRNASPFGAVWRRDGTVLFATNDSVLYRVPPNGTRADPLRITDSTGRAVDLVTWPAALPDDRWLLASGGASASGVIVIDLTTGRSTRLLRGRQPQFVAPGTLLYDDLEGRMRTVAFDPDTRRVTGSPVPAFEALRGSGGGATQVAVSETGTLVYTAGGFQRFLVRTDAAGKADSVGVPPRGYRFPAVSPDGQWLAVTVDPRPSSVWSVDLRTHVMTRLSADGVNAISPVWSVDSRRIVYRASSTLFATARDRATFDTVFRQPPGVRAYAAAEAWMADGRFVGFVTPGLSYATTHLAIFGPHDPMPTPFFPESYNTHLSDVSPDGRWVATTSKATGQWEVEVRSIDRTVRPATVSEGGGAEPHWTGPGTLVYRSGSTIRRVTLRLGDRVERVGGTVKLFDAPYDFSQEHNWTVTRDGRTFYFVRSDAGIGRELRVVFNWRPPTIAP